jgi:Family of unknown function (DUF5989)
MAQAGQKNPLMGMLGLLAAFGAFLLVSKKWWLGPIVVFLVMLGGLLLLAGGSAIAPFIYALF